MVFASAQVHRSPGASGGGHAAKLDRACSDYIGHPRCHHPVCEANMRGHAGGKQLLGLSPLRREMLEHITDFQVPWVLPGGAAHPPQVRDFRGTLPKPQIPAWYLRASQRRLQQPETRAVMTPSNSKTWTTTNPQPAFREEHFILMQNRAKKNKHIGLVLSGNNSG